MKSKFIIAAVAALFVGAVSPAFADTDNVCTGGSCTGTQSGPNDGNKQFQTIGNTAGNTGTIQGGSVGNVSGGAGGYSGGNTQKQSNDNTNVNVNTSKSESEANSASISGAAAKNANAQSVTINNPGTVQYSGEYTVKSAPGIALGGPASGPCNGFSGGVAGSGIGFGFAANASTLDEGCEDRETARMLHLLGDTKAGLELLKTSRAYTRMEERKAEAKKKAEADAEVKKLADEDAARRAAIRQKNPSSDGSWTSGAVEAGRPLPVRIWTGNSDGHSVAYTSYPQQ